MQISISVAEQEYWWGGAVQDGVEMPFTGTDFFARNLKTQKLDNQCASFLVSNKGRYIWSDLPISFRFDNHVLSVEAVDGEVVMEENLGNLKSAYQKASEKYFSPTGKTPDQLLFTAPQYNTWIEMLYEPTQEKILKYADDILKNGMQPGVLIIDDNWQEDYGVWEFSSKRFSDPKKMIRQLHEKGFKVMLWVCNYISPDSYTARALEKNGFLVMDKNTGRMALADWWNGYSAILDITNEKSREWLHDTLQKLMDQYGVDGFKFDAGDMDVLKEDFVYKNTVTPYEYCRMWSEVGLGYSFNEYRASCQMGGKELGQRLSDKAHSWGKEGLKSLIPNGIAQGLLGYTYCCPDMIGGGEYSNYLENSDKLDCELIVRNAQCAALFPMMQFSVAPWRVLPEREKKCCVAMAKLHVKLGNMIWNMVRKSSRTGEPVLRALEYNYPGMGYEKIQDQFMLGEDILVAPVLEKGKNSRNVVFPEGI